MLALAVPTFLSAASINITAPASKAVVRGIYKFSVDTSAAPTVDRVEYRLGSLSLGFATRPPFSLAWNSGLASDGNYQLDATAYDAEGKAIATATQVFDIQNRGGSVTVDATDLSVPLHGRIKLSVTAMDPLYYVARWSVFIDGAQLSTFFSDNSGKNKFTAELPLDTTHVSNGKHELHVEIASNIWPAGQQEKKSWHDARLSLHRVIVTDNGHLPEGIAANLQNVYLEPGKSILLHCLAMYTDDRSAPCASPSYASSNPSTAAVDSFGKITARSVEGFSTIALTSGGQKTEAYVWVKKNLNIPHFSGDGRILTSYQAGSSIFPVAPFGLEVSDVQDPLIDQEAKRAGINTLYSGFYQIHAIFRRVSANGNPITTQAYPSAGPGRRDMVIISTSWVMKLHGALEPRAGGH